MSTATPQPVSQPVPLAQPVAPVAVAAPVVQPAVVYQQPAPAAPTPAALQPSAEPVHDHKHPTPPGEPEAIYLYSRSNFFYWWPVWAVGYLMAFLTYMNGTYVTIGNHSVLFHSSKNLGVLFTVTFFLVILITNVTLRGLSSVVLILTIAFTALALAYFGLWEDLLNWMGRVSIYMNMGFYMFFASLVFVVWAFSVFVYDRLSYWRVRPGQITHENVIGGAEKSNDTRGMVFEKHRDDLFRHWVVGLGSGDLQITTTGAKPETLYIPNVLFIDSKIDTIQRMIATQPDQFTRQA